MITDTIQQAEIARLVRVLPPLVRRTSATRSPSTRWPSCSPASRCTGHTCRRGASHLDAGRPRRRRNGAPISPERSTGWSRCSPIRQPRLRTRFQQTTGPVMAKGVEDTAFYRWTRLGSLTEVGGDPSVFALSVEDFHRANALRQASWPHSMTTLSTHDTKRGEDVRARLDVLAEVPERWAAVLDELRARASTGHGPFDSLLYQAVIGSWPASRERLHAYAEKAVSRGRGGDRLVGSGSGVRDAHARDGRRRLRRSGAARPRRRTSSPRSPPRGGPTRSRRRSCSSPAPVFPTSTRAPSSGRPRSSTPTTAAPSTSPSDAGCWRTSTRRSLAESSRRWTRRRRPSCSSPRAR